MQPRRACIERFNYPDKGALAYLVDYLAEIGEAQQDGNGLVVTGWQDIKAWSDLMGVNLQPNEVIGLRRLSNVYVASYYRFNGVDALDPNAPKLEPVEVEAKLKGMMSAFKKEPVND